MLRLPRNLHLEVHKVLRLPQNLHFELHKALHLERNLHFEVHHVLHLPRNLHFEVHKVHSNTQLTALQRFCAKATVQAGLLSMFHVSPSLLALNQGGYTGSISMVGFEHSWFHLP